MSQFDQSFSAGLAARHRQGRIFEFVCAASTWFALLALAVLIGGIAWQAFGWLDWQYLTSFDSRFPERAGILAGLWGSLWLILFTAIFSVPIGIGAAIYLEEYARPGLMTRIIQINLSNLAGIPSIVYGILGLTVFVKMFGAFDPPGVLDVSLGIVTLHIPLPLGRTVLAGSLTLTLLVLPVIIIASQEALRAVPPSLRHASYALGATQWQTIRNQVLPSAMPGVLTGVILALSRAVGEAAPLIMIGALTYVAFTPGDIVNPVDLVRNPQGVAEAPFGTFTAIPIQVFNWVSRPKVEYQHVAAAGSLVLLALLLLMNGTAIFIRNRFQKRIRW